MCQAILAIDDNDGIGYKGTLPWGRNKEDLQNFKKITDGHSVLMGRGTWDSEMPTPLPNRSNYVVTSKVIINPDVRCLDFKHACMIAEQSNVFLIGGLQLFNSLWSYVTHAHITMVDGVYPADTYFPLAERLQGFRVTDVKELNSYSTYYLYQKV